MRHDCATHPNMTQIMPYKIYLLMMLGGKCFLYFAYVNVFKCSFLYTSLGPASTNLTLEFWLTNE